MVRNCAVCATPTKKTCTGCARKAYCGVKCQDKDWIVHIIDCDNPGRHINGADRLGSYLMGGEDKLRTDNETMLLYGFLTISSREDGYLLREVYTELFRDLGVKPMTLHKAREAGRLYEEIEATYKKAGKKASSTNFVWVRAHPQFFRPKPEQSEFRKKGDSLRLLIWNRMQVGSPKTTIADMDKEVESWPKHKQICFEFYWLVCTGLGPNLLSTDHWRKFGYCVFPESDVTSHPPLTKLYAELISKCTFQEFYTAYTSSSLIALMDRKGLKPIHSKLSKEFHTVLSESPDNVSTIWYLKAFTVGQELVAHRPDPTVLIPYGFTNCRSKVEVNRLLHFYARLFKDYKVPPMQLQAAAENDNLYDYITRLPKVKISTKEKVFLQKVLRTQNRIMFGEGGSSATQWQCLNTWTYFIMMRQIVGFWLYERDTGKVIERLRR